MVTQPIQASDVLAIMDMESVVLLAPLTESARGWLQRSVTPDAQWWGGALVCERRYVAPLVEGVERACRSGAIVLDTVA